MPRLARISVVVRRSLASGAAFQMGTVLGRVVVSQIEPILGRKLSELPTGTAQRMAMTNSLVVPWSVGCKGVIRFAASQVPTMTISRLPTRYSATISVGAKSLVGNP